LHLTISALDICARLFCAVVTGLVIGWNRSLQGRPAGLRTMALVSLAACVAMIQANILLPLSGKAPDSFVVMDLMRLPLGILSGMGFIGAGAILRRDNFVVGVTTAAAMWFVTVLGLCFGGGQFLLGIAGLLIGIAILSGLKVIEDRMRRDHLGKLSIVTGPAGPGVDEIRNLLKAGGFRVDSVAITAHHPGVDRELGFDLQWRAREDEAGIPPAIDALTQRAGVIRLAWIPQLR
jgi:putative Mg2+ transporter-C (MgtC) family protein